MESYEEVLEFWFGSLDGEADYPDDHAGKWFGGDESFDDEIRLHFAELHAEIAAGEHEMWSESPRGRLAMILVLDQFSRNMFRGTPKMFAYDEEALALSLELLDRGMDEELRFVERAFAYMPLMHSEHLAIQQRCVDCFERLLDEVPAEQRERYENYLDFAERHRNIVARFGRFPHRNEVVGRETTEEEAEFLEQPGSSF